MNCERVEKQIIFSDIENICTEDRAAFLEHIDSCDSCKNNKKAMEKYHLLIQEINKTYPTLKNADDFTNQILDSIEADSKTKNNKEVSIINFSLRIAAAITILFILGFYANQKIYVNKSIAELEEQYTIPPEKNEFIRDYNECRSGSETILKDIITNNDELLAMVRDERKTSSPINIKKYSSNICQQSALDFADAPQTQKKELLVKYLRNEL